MRIPTSLFRGHPRRLPLLAGGLVVGVEAAVLAAAGLQATSTPRATGPVPIARLDTTDVHAMRFLPWSDSSLLFGSHDGVRRSDDGGRTWRPLLSDVDAMTLVLDDGGVIFLAGHGGLRRSDDGGLSWSVMTTDLPTMDIHAFAVAEGAGSPLWADVASEGLYRSDDGGNRWERVLADERLLLETVGTRSSATLLGLDPFAGVSRSVDGGATWAVVSRPPVRPVGAFAATPDGTVLVVGGAGGAARSDDGGVTWSALLRGPTVLAADVSADARTVALVTETGDVYRFEGP